MKKSLIALAVAGAAVAASANASEVYNQDGTTLAIGGRAEARMSVIDGQSSDKSRVRLNFFGKTEISDALYGVGFYEVEYSTNDDYTGNDATSYSDDDADKLDHRYLYAGIGGEFGEVDYGKLDAALSVLTDFTDIMDYHGCRASDKLATADRYDNTLVYKGELGDFAVKAAYRFDQRADSPDSGNTLNNGNSNSSYSSDGLEGYSASLIYTVGQTGLAFGAGFADQNSKYGATYGSNNGETGAKQYMLTASWTYEDLYLAALYTTKDYKNNNNDYDGYELAAAYTLDKTLFQVTYNNGQNDDHSDRANDLAIEVAYFFKPNFRGYVSYNFNMLEGDQYSDSDDDFNDGVQDEAVAGFRYDF